MKLSLIESKLNNPQERSEKVKSLSLFFVVIILTAYGCKSDDNPVSEQGGWTTLFNGDYYDSLYCYFPSGSCGSQKAVTSTVNFKDADSIMFQADIKCSGSVHYKIYANSGDAFLIDIRRDSTDWEHISWSVPILQKSEGSIYKETEISHQNYYVLKNLKIYKK